MSDAGQFAKNFHVSRETMAQLLAYAALLGKWQQKINLVGPATMPDLWARHMADSAQVYELAGELAGRQNGIWLDLGSGGGFPGLVIALLMAAAKDGSKGGKGRVHLVESDQRKARFLQAVIRETNAPAQVHSCRIEDLSAHPSDELAAIDFVTARALAPLPKLLDYVAPFCHSSTTAFLFKGRSWREELTCAQQLWKINFTAHASRTDAAARILAISGLISHI